MCIRDRLSTLVSWEEFTVLDLYAGSGALGIEALSRGAKNTIFVEAHLRHMKVLIENIESISIDQDRYRVVHDNALNWIPKFTNLKKPSITFLDPPFYGDEYSQILKKLALLSNINTGSIIVVESLNSRKIDFPSSFKLLKRRSYGYVSLDILQKD